MAGAPATKRAAVRAPRQRRRAAPGKLPRVASQSLLDVVDTVIDKGLAVDAEVVLGLADIDLIYLRVGALLAAADRVFTGTPKTRGRIATTVQSSSEPARAATITDREGLRSGIVTNDLDAAPASARTLAPDDTSRSVIRLVLTLVEFVRQLLERQAVRRVRERTLNAAEIERLGTALMRLEATVHELAERHGIDATELNLDLGPLGTLR